MAGFNLITEGQNTIDLRSRGCEIVGRLRGLSAEDLSNLRIVRQKIDQPALALRNRERKCCRRYEPSWTTPGSSNPLVFFRLSSQLL
jgi:hypothetical protein